MDKGVISKKKASPRFNIITLLIAILLLLNPLVLSQKFYLFFPYKILIIQIFVFVISIAFVLLPSFRIQNKVVCLCILAFLLYNVIVTILSSYSFSGINVLVYLIPHVILFLVLSQLDFQYRERKLIANAIILGFVLGIISGYFLQSSSGDFSRLSLNWANPDYYASYLLTLIGFVAYKWKVSADEKEKNLKYIYASLFILCLIFLFWTQSRGALVAFFAITALFWLIYLYRKRNFRLLIISLIFISLAFIIFLMSFQFIRPATIVFRERFYNSGFQYIKDFWLTGSGPGTFVHFYPKYRSPDYGIVGEEDIITHVHNEFIELWAETGIIGLLLFLTFIVLTIREALRKIKLYDDERRYFVFACLLSFLFFITHNLFTITMRIAPLQFYFFLFAGLIFADYNSDKRLPKNGKIHRRTGRKRYLWIIIPLFVWLIGRNVQNIKGFTYLQESKEKFSTTSPSHLNVSIQAGEKALKYIPYNHEVLYHLGYSNFYAKEYEKSLKYFDNLLAIYPFYPQAHFWKGYTYSYTGLWDLAIQEYSQELRLNQSPKVYFNLAIAYMESGEEENSVSFFMEYLEKVREMTEKNLVKTKEDILKEEKRNLGFALRTLETYYQKEGVSPPELFIELKNFYSNTFR
jgi:O-antigen ligase